jgi:hypothetical protein
LFWCSTRIFFDQKCQNLFLDRREIEFFEVLRYVRGKRRWEVRDCSRDFFLAPEAKNTCARALGLARLSKRSCADHKNIS